MGQPPSTILGADASRLAVTRFTDLQWRAEVESTNSELLGRARAGVPEGAVLVADFQTAGRGRLGRSWHAPPGGSLLVSVLLRPGPGLAARRLGVVSLAGALAMADAVEEVAGFRPGLKWPNDLVVGERKLAGILAEADLIGSEVTGLVLGTGVNVVAGSFPAELADRATAVELMVGRSVDRGELLVGYLAELERRYRTLLAPGGTDSTLESYRRACVTLGRPVRVELPGRALHGIAAGLGPGGELVVLGPGGSREQVAAGDVVHLRGS